MPIVNRKSKIVNEGWLPDMDLNHDKQIQSLLCYRYTIGQYGPNELRRISAAVKSETRGNKAAEECRVTRAFRIE